MREKIFLRPISASFQIFLQAEHSPGIRGLGYPLRPRQFFLSLSVILSTLTSNWILSEIV